MANENRILVVGGGIAGLSTAIALRRAGIPVTVFERAPGLHTIGGAIQIWANGMRALRDLGVADRVREVSADVTVQQFGSSGGRELLRIDVGELARRNGVDPPVMVMRGDLLEILADAAGADTIRFGREYTGHEQDAEGVTVSFADGSTERGAALIAADGTASAVRLSLFPEATPHFTGYQYLRALTKFEGFPKGAFTFTFGRGGNRFGIHDSPGCLYWFGVIVNKPGTDDPPEGRKADLLARFGGFPSPIPELIEATPEEDISRTDIRDLTPLERWTDGRVTLLGDAAHATTPNLGRGAGESIEDAVTLARCIVASPDDVPAALRAYEDERREPTADVQQRSRRLGELSSRANPIFLMLRDVIFTRKIGPSVAQRAERDFAELGAAAERS